MFHNLYQLGERQAGEASKAAFIDATRQDITSQSKQLFEEAAVETHEQNMGLLSQLEEAGSSLDVPDLIDQFNEGIKGVSRLRMWNAHAEPFSWVAYAPAQIGADFSPLDGVRAVHGWRIHWANKSRRAPGEMAIMAYQSQTGGELQPFRLAAVPNALPACCDHGSRPSLTDTLTSETGVLYDFKRLATVAYSDCYESLTNKERGHYIAEMRAITGLFAEKQQHGVSPHSLFINLFLRRKSNLVWTERPGSGARSPRILEKPYQEAVASILRLAFSEKAMERVLPGSPELGDDVTFQSYNLQEVNSLFAPPTKTKKWLGLWTVHREGGLVGGGSWEFGTPVLAGSNLHHRERVAEELERICVPTGQLQQY